MGVYVVVGAGGQIFTHSQRQYWMEVFKFQHPSCFITGQRDAWCRTIE